MAIMDTNPESNNQYQYIQDTSLASLDSKTSPLAMLVRTCSQIGADPPMATAAKSKKPAATAPVSASAAAADRPHSASPASAAYLGHATVKHPLNHHHNNNNNINNNNNNNNSSHNNNYLPEKPAKLNFKPYENTVLTPSPHHQLHHVQHHSTQHYQSPNEDESRPKSSSSEDNGGGHGHGHGHGKKRKSASPRDEPYHHHHSTAKSSRRSSSSASSSETVPTAVDPSTNPIIRSGLEVMHGAAAAKAAFCPPPPMPAHSPYKPCDPLAAFRHTYLPGAPWMPAAVSLAAAAAAKPSPDCKDPMCGGPASGCGSQQQQQQQHHHHQMTAAALAFASQYHPMMAAAGGCPAGCAQCDHQRYLSSLMAAAAAVPAFYAPVARPYTCSWVIPGGNGANGSGGHQPSSEAAAVPSLCGKSFGTSDELLQHIRTHTSGSGAASVSAAASAMAAGPMSPTTAAAFSAYNSHLSRHLFHHPSAAAAYGKPPTPSMMPPSPYSAFNPTAAYCYPPPSGYHHPHPLYSPRGDTSAATVSR